MKPMTDTQSTALKRIAAFDGPVGVNDAKSATVNNLIARGYLAVVPVPANNGLHYAVITQAGRDAAFAALLAA